MNFQKIQPIPNAKQMLDVAFRQAIEKATHKKFKGERLQIYKQQEVMKLDLIKEYLIARLEQIVNTFPHTEELPQFYQKLMNLTIDVPAYKKSLGALTWALGKMRGLHRNYVQGIRQTKEWDRVKEFTHEFYGRISSFLKQVKVNLEYLEECRKVMKNNYPDIKELPTVCLYGFPNVGKTTLLNKLTGTRAEVAAYAFTTKSINAGYLKIGEKRTIQILDVPGTLAREEKYNNIELQADLVLEELANLIVFVFDLTESSGYSLEKQEQLLKRLQKKEKKVIIYVSKRDMLDEEQLKGFHHKYYSFEEIKELILQFFQAENFFGEYSFIVAKVWNKGI